MDPELARLRRRTANAVAIAAEMPVGPTLVAALNELKSAPMHAGTAVDVHALWAKVIAWASAQQMIATQDAVIGIRGPVALPAGEAAMLTAQELACATHVAYPTAMTSVALVERVAQCLPASWVALDRGEFTMSHLKAVEKATRHCPPRVAEVVDEQVVALAVARGWTPGETAKAARKLMISLDPQGAKGRAAAAKDDADVQLYPGADETSSLAANGDATKAQRIMDAINDRAEAMGRAGDGRNVGVRRFDALADLVLNNTGQGSSSVRVETHVRIDLTTLLGLNDNPGELIGYGPITAETARLIAADSMLRRLVFDPLTGDTLDLGLRSYRPSAALKRLIEATHPSCTMPGCSRPSIHCEIDHRKERHDGGRTDRCNLRPLCKMHHQMKTKKWWKVDVNPDGSEAWTSYLGRTYIKKPRHFLLPEPLPEPLRTGENGVLPRYVTREAARYSRSDVKERASASDSRGADPSPARDRTTPAQHDGRARTYDQARAVGLVA
ncbi:MAG TPA: hypothetical protein VHV76_06560 [Mycobacteriales bacterium]|nr:hypothetical protein [Mycobacteriales bacterium]